jgi:hypothetical protein
MEEITDTEHIEYINKISQEINAFLIEKDVSLRDGLCCLTTCLIQQCLFETNIKKTTLLAYISNSWEMNDPDNQF